MRRSSFALVTVFFALVAVGVCWPGTLWAHKAHGPDAATTADAGDHQGRGNGKGRGNDKHRGSDVVQRSDEGRAVERPDAWRDRDHCRVVVTDYYDRRGLPPGLAKKQSLPPGLQKQLRERGHLPPGLEKHLVPLPVDLERRLPPLPPHYCRRAVGGDLLVIDVRTNFVVSVMAGVFIR